MGAGGIMGRLNLRRFRAVAMLVLTSIVGAGLLSFAQPAALTVLSRDGRKPLPITTINSQDYVAVDDINTVFGTTSREDRLAGGLTITLRGRSIVVTADQNVVSVSGRCRCPRRRCGATIAGSCPPTSCRGLCR